MDSFLSGCQPRHVHLPIPSKSIASLEGRRTVHRHTGSYSRGQCHWSSIMATRPHVLGGGTPYTRPARNSNVSPFRGTAKAPRILFIAMLRGKKLQQRQGRASANDNRGWRWKSRSVGRLRGIELSRSRGVVGGGGSDWRRQVLNHFPLGEYRTAKGEWVVGEAEEETMERGRERVFGAIKSCPQMAGSGPSALLSLFPRQLLYFL
jgi:hypothetical protein